MTIYTSIVINEDGTNTYVTDDVLKAEEIEYEMRANGSIRTESFGDIDGSAYTVIYYKDGMKNRG